MKRRGLLLSILLWPFSGKTRQQETKNIKTPGGAVSLKIQNIAQVLQQVLPVDALEVKKIHELGRAAKHFLAVYCPGAEESLKSYDAAFRVWQSKNKRQFPAAAVIDQLGAYLGNKLAADLDMEWVTVTDQYGTESAVRAKKYEVISFPFSAVAKRIERNEYDFMEGLYYAVQHTIASEPMKR